MEPPKQQTQLPSNAEEALLKLKLSACVLLGLFCVAGSVPALGANLPKRGLEASYLLQGFGVAERLSKPPSLQVRKQSNVAAVSRRGRWQTARKLSSRGGWSHVAYLDMEATAYDPGPISCGPKANGYTATGMKAGYGVVAVDPRVIPLGTRVYVEGYGYAIAADTGGAIQGNRIDLCYNTYREAIQYGRRMARVYLLGR